MKSVTRCFLLSVATAASVFAIPVRQVMAQVGTTADAGANQLIVLFDPADVASPTPDQIIADVNSARSKSSLPTQLGNPIAAELVLDPVSLEFASLLASHPLSPRALLQDYVLLTYMDAAATSSARDLLASDSRVMAVESNASAMQFSATPNDHYYADGFFPPDPTQYQWGMEALNMPQAWDLAWGHGYVAAIDTGIPCTANCATTSHSDLVQNFRPQFSRAFYAGQPNTNFVDPYGHGTHVSGIVSATPEFGPFSNHQPNTGVAGVCWTCSFSMIRTDLTPQSEAKSWTWAADHGMQAVNMSWGDEYNNTLHTNCRQAPPDSRLECKAIAYAAERDVVLIGASGNGYKNRVQWPAREPGVIAVGGMQYDGGFWRDGYGYNLQTGGAYACTPGVPGPECGSNYGPEQQIVAPAMDIVSTITLEYNTVVHCGDSFGPPGIDGYGDCTGTSMAAPHVTGLVGLLRSVDPLLSKDQIKSLLVSHTTPCTGVDSSKCGNGIPNASAATQAAFGNQGAVNRLTPLFSFYSSTAQDHFYTTVPQMALAALSPGQLVPQPIGGAISYDSIGIGVSGYTEFPTPVCTFSPCFAYDTPEASISVFTSHVSPIDGSVLAPLHRYSYACTSASGSFCSAHPSDTSHVYASNRNENWEGQGYQYDGIEGYIYPPTVAQPAGTTKLCRAYDDDRDDWVLFPGAGTNGLDCSAVTDGLTGGNYNHIGNGSHVSLGWVYSVRAPQAICAGGAVCAVDLTVTKSHAGNFVRGQIGATYSIVVHNSGNLPSSGSVSVLDLLPAGLTATSISGSGWTCTLGSLSCARGDSLAVAANYPTITVTVNVATNAPASVTNMASVSGGGDIVATNNSASDATTIVACTSASCGPDLTITKSHTGTFMRGQHGATYTITVANSGAYATTAAVSVVDALPTGLTPTALSGTGWSCTIGTLTCTRSSIAAGASFPITLVADVAVNAPASVTNVASVSGGGDVVATNNSASDATTIVACTNATCAPDLTITKSHVGNFMLGQVGATYSIVVHNSGAQPTTAPVSVSDALPSGLTATAISGSGWTCTLSPLSCSRSSILAAGADFPPVSVVVNVALSAPAGVTNSATTSGGGEIFSINDTTNDPTTIVACTNATCAPDLTITKSHVGNFMRGQVGAAYSIVVHNSGAQPTTAPVSVSDALPAGLTATSISGSGWTCTLSPLSCSRSSILTAGADFPPVSVVVNVALSAPASVTNSATTSGGGEIFSINDTTSDPTTIVACTNATCAPDLTITKSHVGNFILGQVGATYSIVVHNSGAQPTTAPVSVSDTLPTGLTATAISGSGWTCTLSPLSCSRSSILAAGADFPPVSVVVNVALNAPASVTNSATTSGGGEIFSINDTTSDPTTIMVDSPDIAVSVDGPNLTAHATNVSQTAFTGYTLKVTFNSNTDGSGVAVTGPSNCSLDSGTYSLLVASFTCSMGGLAPQSSANLVFSATSVQGASGNMSVSLIPPTSPADTNSANNAANAAVTYGGQS